MVHKHGRRMLGAAALLLLAGAAGCTCGSTDNAGPAPGKAAPGADTASGREAPGRQRGGESAAGDTVPPSELEYVEMKVSIDDITGDPKEDNFRYIKVWGELKNKSSRWIQQIVGDIRYFDASGKELGIDSISTAVKEDVGDTSPGERVSSDVRFIAPGATVPMHHIRALGKIGGKVGSHKITLRPARVVTKYPEGVLEGIQDQVATVANESLPNSSPHEHRVITATLRNKGNLGCRDPGVVVGYYDAGGKLADLKEGDAKGELNTVLAPGATTTVKVFTLVGFDDAWKAKATIKTWARCSEPYD